MASLEAAVGPSMRKPSWDGLFPKLSLTRKAYGLRATGYVLEIKAKKCPRVSTYKTMSCNVVLNLTRRPFSLSLSPKIRHWGSDGQGPPKAVHVTRHGPRRDDKENSIRAAPGLCGPKTFVVLLACHRHLDRAFNAAPSAGWK